MRTPPVVDDAATVRGGGQPSADRPLVLLLHGYGSHERDLVGLGLPAGWAWASLRAPLTLGSGAHAWFPVTTPGRPDPEPVADTTAVLLTWLDEHVDAGAPVVPVGFSQGGLMASHLLRTAPDRFAGAALLGGFVHQDEQPGDGRLDELRPPVYSGRGDADGVITAEAVARTDAWLPRFTTPHRHVYAGLGHGISRAMVTDLMTFLGQVPLGARPV